MHAQPSTMPPDPVTTFLAANRKRAGLLFLLVSLLWAGPAVYCTYKSVTGWGTATKAQTPDPDKPEAEPDKEKDEQYVPPDPNFNYYLFTAIFAGLGAIITAAGGLWILAALPGTSLAEEMTRMRSALLAVGVLGGLLLMLIGLWYFVGLFDILTQWITTGTPKNAWKILTAMLVFVFGAGLAFIAVQPARAEERNNQQLRRLVYGSNLGITVMLLLMLLVAVNIIAGVKLPNKLDTTASGFYSLQPTTQTFIQQLDQPVTVYILMPEEGPPFTDMRRLVQAAADANPSKFIVRYLSQTTLADIQKVKSKFPQADVEDYGIIVAVGQDEDRYTFIRAGDFIKRDRGQAPGDPGKAFFQGESILMKELIFLAENRTKPIVYFTQGHGELSLGGGFGMEDTAGPSRSIATLKSHLEKNNIEVRPLTFEIGKAKVPDDATLVVVADPRSGLSPDAVQAITTYMNTPNADGKKGKLLLMHGPNPTPGNTGVQPSGLEGLLAQFNIQPRLMYLYNQPTQRMPPNYVNVGVTRSGVTIRMPTALALQEMIFPIPDTQVIDASREGANPEIQATTILATAEGITWLEPTRPADPVKVFTDMVEAQDRELIMRKQVDRRSRPIGAVASENGVGRVVVIGSGALFSDDYAQRIGEGNPAAQILSTSLDWLRERRDVPDVVNKPFEFYTLPSEYDGIRLYMLPLLLAVLALGALGAGVWVVRRQ